MGEAEVDEEDGQEVRGEDELKRVESEDGMSEQGGWTSRRGVA